jgi:hypothetical protein
MCEDCDIFLSAFRAWMQGGSPYMVAKFFSPPWVLLVVAPLAWLPTWVIKAVWLLASTCAFYAVARRYLDVPRAIAFMLSYPVLHSILIGNLDWLVMLSLLTPPWASLLLCSLKPHIGLGLIAKLLLEKHWRIAIPLLCVLLASFVLFGWWPAEWIGVPELTSAWNVASFPWLLPLGMALLSEGIATDDAPLCLAAAALMVPHVSISSLPVLMLPILRKRWGWVAVIAQWAIIIVIKT